MTDGLQCNDDAPRDDAGWPASAECAWRGWADKLAQHLDQLPNELLERDRRALGPVMHDRGLSGHRTGGTSDPVNVAGTAASAREVWASTCRHIWGPWLACACEFGIHDHTETVPWFQIIGWCGHEFRRCRACPHWQERRADEDPTAPVDRVSTSGGGHGKHEGQVHSP